MTVVWGQLSVELIELDFGGCSLFFVFCSLTETSTVGNTERDEREV